MDPTPVFDQHAQAEAIARAQPYTKFLFTYVFVTFSYIGCLLTVQAIDIISGVFAAAIKGRVSSSIGFVGLMKKVAIWLAIGLVLMVSREAGVSYIVRPLFWAFIWLEFLSCVENLTRCGVKMPDFVIKALYVMRDARVNGEKFGDLSGKLGLNKTEIIKETHTEHTIVLPSTSLEAPLPVSVQNPIPVVIKNENPVPVTETKSEEGVDGNE